MSGWPAVGVDTKLASTGSSRNRLTQGARMRGAAASLIVPWFAVMAVSASVAYALNGAITGGASVVAKADDPIILTNARPSPPEACGWMIYVGLNSWIRDPTSCGRNDAVNERRGPVRDATGGDAP